MSKDNFLSARINNIQISPTMAVVGKAKAMQASGINVISFGAGEPDFDTPQNIKEAAIRAIQNGETKYTPVSGTLALKQAIQTKLKRDQNLDYKLSEISTACGGKHSLYNIFQVLIGKGDEVIIPAPFWVSYPDQVVLAEGKPVIVQTSEAHNFCMTPAEFEKAITSKTKALVLTSPNNPTGSAYTRNQLLELANICLRHHIFIISDEIYEKLIYDDFEVVSAAELSEEIKNITFIVNGVSKAYAMTGWRMGFTAGPEWLIAAIDKLQGQSTSNICSITQAASAEALGGSQDAIKTMVQAFKRRRDNLVESLNQIDGIRCNKPQGAFYVFPNIKQLLGRTTPRGKTIESCVDLCDYLLEDAHVAVVAGFGFGAPGYMRMSYATSDELISEGVNRIREAVAKLK